MRLSGGSVKVPGTCSIMSTSWEGIAVNGQAPVGGHVFISHGREDSARVDRLEQILAEAGIPVWRDAVELRPGDDRRMRVREAITRDAVVLVACFAAGLAAGLQGSFSLAAAPTSVMRQNITYALMIALTIALAGGLAGGLAYGFAVGLAFGLAGGLAVGLVAGLVSGLEVWVRYLTGCWLARRKGLLPRRVGRFLDWAYRANLLRMSGTAAQFRHRELQDWLARNSSVVLPDQTNQPQEAAS